MFVRRGKAGSRSRAVLVVALGLAIGLPSAARATGTNVPTSIERATFSPSGLPLLGKLEYGGRWMLDAEGRVVMPHGLMNYNPAIADAPFFGAHGFDVQRVPIHMSEVMPQPGVYSDDGLRDLKQRIDALGAEGIYTLLDAHEDGYGPELGPDGMPQWMQDTQVRSVAGSGADTGVSPPTATAGSFPADNFADPATNAAWRNFWHNEKLPNGVSYVSETGQTIERLQDAYVDFWRHVATIFAGDPSLYGYDLMNEPWPGADYPYPSCGTVDCPEFEPTYLSPFNKKVVAAIHAVDPQTLTSYEPNVQASSAGAPMHLLPNSQNADDNSGINFHPYCLSGLWGAPGLSAGAVAPDPAEDAVCNRNIDLAFAETDAHQQSACDDPAPGKYCAPAIISEFGSSEYNAETAHVLARADERMIPWIFFQKTLVTGTSSTAQKVLPLVERPYAYAVAGTPTHFDYVDGYKLEDGSLCPNYNLGGTPACPATRRFTLEYSTAPHDPSRHKVKATTLIFVPGADYPSGYRVEVTGATVLPSAAGSQWIELANLQNAETVRVVITPAA